MRSNATILFLMGSIEFMYAAFNKETQTITFSYPVVLSNQAVFQGQMNDTVSNPSYTWSNDVNTGFYHPANDAIGFVTDGVERMRVISTGSIGIGTTAPSSRFHVHGTSTAFTVNNGGNVGIGTSNPVSGFSMQIAGYSLMPMPIAIFEEKYTSGSGTVAWTDGSALSLSVAAPTAITGANTWRVRRLNTFTHPTAVGDFVRSFVNLDTTNFHFTLGVGTYHIHAEGTGISVGRHRIALTSSASTSAASLTNPTFVLAGTSEITNPVASSTLKDFLNNNLSTVTNLCMSKSVISGFFTVTDASLRYRIQHYTNQTDSIGAFGCPSGFSSVSADDIYLRVIISRYA